eukprot:TRINITY_DN1032_c0_g1_i1.p2 TRINITY_DN1032_c0_g1~~TRINITY_DN1032_c0_g1_i1.p2  ORF type:complete len:267 (-),score=-22.79 TRINITY_DN1032_c0_g1_i1:529-1329(-)
MVTLSTSCIYGGANLFPNTTGIAFWTLQASARQSMFSLYSQKGLLLLSIIKARDEIQYKKTVPKCSEKTQIRSVLGDEEVHPFKHHPDEEPACDYRRNQNPKNRLTENKYTLVSKERSSKYLVAKLNEKQSTKTTPDKQEVIIMDWILEFFAIIDFFIIPYINAESSKLTKGTKSHISTTIVRWVLYHFKFCWIINYLTINQYFLQRPSSIQILHPRYKSYCQTKCDTRKRKRNSRKGVQGTRQSYPRHYRNRYFQPNSSRPLQKW